MLKDRPTCLVRLTRDKHNMVLTSMQSNSYGLPPQSGLPPCKILSDITVAALGAWRKGGGVPGSAPSRRGGMATHKDTGQCFHPFLWSHQHAFSHCLPSRNQASVKFFLLAVLNSSTQASMETDSATQQSKEGKGYRLREHLSTSKRKVGFGNFWAVQTWFGSGSGVVRSGSGGAAVAK